MIPADALWTTPVHDSPHSTERYPRPRNLRESNNHNDRLKTHRVQSFGSHRAQAKSKAADKWREATEGVSARRRLPSAFVAGLSSRVCGGCKVGQGPLTSVILADERLEFALVPDIG